MKCRQCRVDQSVEVRASAASIWEEVTQVDLASFRHSPYFTLLGIPKPLRAEVLRVGNGGARVATFSNGRRFTQEITDWQPNERFAFTFRADPGFRVGHCLDLSKGPLRMISGAYRIKAGSSAVQLILSSHYELDGIAGALIEGPVRLVLRAFQSSLLRGLRANAERRERGLAAKPQQGRAE